MNVYIIYKYIILYIKYILLYIMNVLYVIHPRVNIKSSVIHSVIIYKIYFYIYKNE